MDQKRLNGVVEDIGAVIGYTACSALVDWFGGGYLRIPNSIEVKHPVCRVIGEPAFKRLIAEFGGTKLWIPLDYQREQDRRDRMIAVMFHLGLGSKQIASLVSMSERHVQLVRQRVEELGLLPLIIKRAGIARKSGREMPGDDA
ncbi:MAG: Mor transcription activator family protein [Burkholderiales bacterium]|jgi:hypothetical protein